MKRLLTVLFAVPLLAISAAAQQRAVVRVDDASVLGTPSSFGQAVELLPRGYQVKVFVTDGSWALVQAGEYTGWIRNDLLIFVSTGEKDDQPIVLSRSSEADNSSGTIRRSVSDRSPTVVLVPVTVASPTSIKATSAPSEDQVATGSCKDGTLTYAETKQGACSDHGGVDTWYADSDRTETTPTSSGGTVQVKGYYRKDGTYVHPHTRSAPGSGRRKP